MDELRFAIIHSLDKVSGSATATLRTRDSVLDTTKETVRSLAEQLARLVGRDGSSVFWGQFGTNRREGLFPSSVQQLVNNCIEESFVAMSKVAMDELLRKATEENFATGGHVCFFAYRVQATTFILVAMIKERAGILLSAELEPTAITEIDLSKLHQAARVNLDRYGHSLAPVGAEGGVDGAEDATEKTYLCFINRKSQSDIAGYFSSALGCEKGVASGRTTKAVIKAVHKFVKSVGAVSEKAAAARLAVIDYMQEQEDGANITLDKIVATVRNAVGVDFEHHIEGLKEHLNGDAVQIPDEFPVSAKAVRTFTRITGKSPRWQISFENGALGVRDADIVYDANERSLKLTRLPLEMVKQVEEALAARSQLPTG